MPHHPIETDARHASNIPQLQTLRLHQILPRLLLPRLKIHVLHYDVMLVMGSIFLKNAPQHHPTRDELFTTIAVHNPIALVIHSTQHHARQTNAPAEDTIRIAEIPEPLIQFPLLIRITTNHTHLQLLIRIELSKLPTTRRLFHLPTQALQDMSLLPTWLGLAPDVLLFKIRPCQNSLFFTTRAPSSLTRGRVTI